MLDATQRASFLERGHFWVRGALSRERVEAWVATALAAIQARPETVYECADGRVPAAQVRRYRPDAPRTWARSRLTYLGERARRVDTLSPASWDAMTALVGGADRLAEATWGDRVIFTQGIDRLPHGLSRRLPPMPLGPFGSWHFDAPRPDATLADQRVALVAIVLLSDIPRRAGATAIACDSVPRLVRHLEAHPRGVDLDARRLRVRIALGCRDVVELTGEAGDVAILHPLMLHSPTRHPRGRVRLISNPVSFLREPWSLHPEAPAPSLLEAATRRYLRRPGAFPLRPRAAAPPAPPGDRLVRSAPPWLQRLASDAGLAVERLAFEVGGRLLSLELAEGTLEVRLCERSDDAPRRWPFQSERLVVGYQGGWRGSTDEALGACRAVGAGLAGHEQDLEALLHGAEPG